MRLLMMLSLFISVSSEAAAPSTVTTRANTAFERYLLNFHQSSVGTEDDFQGWYSGSCVTSVSPNFEQGKFYLADFVSAGQCSNQKTFNFIFGGEVGLPKDAYDDMSDAEMLTYANYMNGSEFKSLISYRDADGALAVNVTFQDHILTIRKHSNGFIYLRGQLAKNTNKDYIDFMCEFRINITPFKKLTPKNLGTMK